VWSTGLLGRSAAVQVRAGSQPDLTGCPGRTVRVRVPTRSLLELARGSELAPQGDAPLPVDLRPVRSRGRDHRMGDGRSATRSPRQPTAYMAPLMAIAMVGLVVVIATRGDSALRVPPRSPMVDLLASNRERREGRMREVCL